MKIGHSSDIHRLEKGRPLILGGVNIPYHLGFFGHSDADVLVHVIAEAIIGALGLGDLGKHFPDTDEKYRNINSLEILEAITTMMEKEKYTIGNVDSLVIIEEPKLQAYIPEMKSNIAEVLKCKETKINIKATSAEGLGFIGSKQGAMATAVVLLEEENE